MTTFTIPDLNIDRAERLICVEALNRGGSILDAAELMGITRHSLKRRIIKHHIEWPRSSPATQPESAASS